MHARFASFLTVLAALLTLVSPGAAYAQTSTSASASGTAEGLSPPPPPPPVPTTTTTTTAPTTGAAAPTTGAAAPPPMTVPVLAPPPSPPPPPTPAASAPVVAPSEVPKAWQYAPAAPPAPKMVKDTYTGHVFLADGVALGLIFLGAQVQADALVGAGVLGYFLGGPIVHSAHGRGKTSAASLGLRVLGPLASGAVGAGVFQIAYGRPAEGGDYAAVIGFAVGGAVGLVVCPILDATVLARTEWLNDLPLVPQVSLGPKGGSVGLAGVF